MWIAPGESGLDFCAIAIVDQRGGPPDRLEVASPFTVGVRTGAASLLRCLARYDAALERRELGLEEHDVGGRDAYLAPWRTRACVWWGAGEHTTIANTHSNST